MKKIHMFCLSTKPETLSFIKKAGYIPVGLGEKKFNNLWLTDITKKNISKKNLYYGENTFHYWLWKNKLKTLPKNTWIGFCQYRRFWHINDKKNSDQISRSVNQYNFLKSILRYEKKEWNDYDVVLGEPLIVDKIKLSKILKNGGINSILNNLSLFLKREVNVKFHFDIFHGNGNLEKAITKLDNINREDFKNFVIQNKSFNRVNMFICRKPKIMELYYKSLFKWLKKCESIFGFEKSSYGRTRIYAFLSERYLSYWFKKNTRYLEWPIFFFDPTIKSSY